MVNETPCRPVDERPIVWILSYPRSGNHLVRTYVEFMTKRATIGRFNGSHDPPIYQKTNNNRLNVDPAKRPVAVKAHYATTDVLPFQKHGDQLILILRSPVENLQSHNSPHTGIKEYENNIDFFEKFEGRKLLLYYEDITARNGKVDFVKNLGRILNSGQEMIDETLRRYKEIDDIALGVLARRPKSHNNPHYYNAKRPRSVLVHCKYKSLLARYPHIVYSDDSQKLRQRKNRLT